MLRILTAAKITARMLVTARMMIIKPCLLLQHKKLANAKREKLKERGNDHQNLRHLVQGILPLPKNHSRKVILPKATDLKSYLNLSHKWELPGEMADYANHQFKYLIPEKDVEENLLILQLVPKNIRGVKKLDDFVKSIMGQSAQVLNQDATMVKSQQKILDVLGPLSRLWKRLEDIKNAPDDTVPVPAKDYIKLIKQTVLLLG